MSRGVMHGKPIPNEVACLPSVEIRQRFPAVNMEVIHDQVDRCRFRILIGQTTDPLRELRPRTVWGGNVKCRPALGSTAQKTFAVPQRWYSLSYRASRPGTAGEARRTAACSVTGFSSKHTTGSCGS
jgi:hypothetical protein